MQDTGTKPPKSPWIERGVFLVVIAALGSWLAYSVLVGVPHSILVDGKPAVTLESRSEAKSALDEVRSRQLGDRRVGTPAFAQRVSVRRATADAEIDTKANAVAALDGMLVLKALGYAVVVDDDPVIALVSEKDAHRALDLLKQRYTQHVKNLYSRPSFKEDVIVERRYLPVERIASSAENAAAYLTAVRGKPTYHTLRSGDRAVRLTAQYGVSLEDIARLNPNVNLDRLVEGDRLLIRMPKQPITVVVKTLTSTITPVRSPAVRGMPAKTGKRQVWAMITYENGREVAKEATRVMTTWDKPAKRQTYTGKRSYRTSSSTRSSTPAKPKTLAPQIQPTAPPSQPSPPAQSNTP